MFQLLNAINEMDLNIKMRDMIRYFLYLQNYLDGSMRLN